MSSPTISEDLPVLGSIVDMQWAACDPVYMGLGPTMAASQLLQRHYLHPSTIDYWEINEAFAGQVLTVVSKPHWALRGPSDPYGTTGRTRARKEWR